MNDTMIIEVTNKKAVRLLHELEELHLIKVVRKNATSTQTKISDKYKGVFSKEDAESFDLHTQKMRDEWNDI
jgi:hypothetical protein